MRQISFAASVLLLAVALVAFPAPPPPFGLAVFMFAILLLLDWSWNSTIGFTAWGGLQTRSEEISTDFYSLKSARWRYLLALAVAVTNATAAANFSEETQVEVLIGSVALFVLYGLIDIFRSRKRVAEGR